MKKVTLTIMLALFVATGAWAQGTRYYVNVNVSGSNGSGDSWGNAFTTLQDAITAASSIAVDTIFVAKGEYTQTTEYLLDSKDINIYGSFKGDGTETSLADRVIGTNIGDTTILDAKSVCRVFYLKNLTNATVIDDQPNSSYLAAKTANLRTS